LGNLAQVNSLSIKKPLKNNQQEGSKTQDESLNQVREILFGEKAKNIDLQLTQLEQRLKEVIAFAEKAANRQIETLKSSLQNEVSDLSQKILDQETETKKVFSTIEKTIQDLSGSVDKKLSQVTENEQESKEKLRAEILNEIEDTKLSIQSQAEASLEKSKDRRSSLASVLADLASKLEDDI